MTWSPYILRALWVLHVIRGCRGGILHEEFLLLWWNEGPTALAKASRMTPIIFVPVCKAGNTVVD